MQKCGELYNLRGKESDNIINKGFTDKSKAGSSKKQQKLLERLI